MSYQIIKGASLSCLSKINDLRGHLIDQLTSCQTAGRSAGGAYDSSVLPDASHLTDWKVSAF